MFITNAWYEKRWWGEGFSSEHYKCTAEHLAAVALYSLAPVFSEFPDEDSDIEAEPNIVSVNLFCIVHNIVTLLITSNCNCCYDPFPLKKGW